MDYNNTCRNSQDEISIADIASLNADEQALVETFFKSWWWRKGEYGRVVSTSNTEGAFQFPIKYSDLVSMIKTEWHEDAIKEAQAKQDYRIKLQAAACKGLEPEENYSFVRSMVGRSDNWVGPYMRRIKRLDMVLLNVMAWTFALLGLGIICLFVFICFTCLVQVDLSN
ncbi:hypothetical protein HAP94_18735 [Acidithiobacillus ferrivorans]|nr:hypothetical protein [Acidithiobacillus ferrivorans]